MYLKKCNDYEIRNLILTIEKKRVFNFYIMFLPVCNYL